MVRNHAQCVSLNSEQNWNKKGGAIDNAGLRNLVQPSAPQNCSPRRQKEEALSRPLCPALAKGGLRLHLRAARVRMLGRPPASVLTHRRHAARASGQSLRLQLHRAGLSICRRWALSKGWGKRWSQDFEMVHRGA